VDAGGAGDESACCGRRSRVVLTPRRWRQVGGKVIPQATVANKPGHRGEHEAADKTIARGMSGETGVTVVTTLVCFFILHARLRAHRAPGIPCALFIEDAMFPGKTRAKRRGEIAKPRPRTCGCLRTEFPGAKRNPGPIWRRFNSARFLARSAWICDNAWSVHTTRCGASLARSALIANHDCCRGFSVPCHLTRGVIP
jgi:hypothetical protein